MSDADPLSQMRTQVDAAYAAADRLVREAESAALPPELTHQLAQAARELLIALRALIDWWIARLEREPGAPVEVEDIPID